MRRQFVIDLVDKTKQNRKALNISITKPQKTSACGGASIMVFLASLAIYKPAIRPTPSNSPRATSQPYALRTLRDA